MRRVLILGARGMLGSQLHKLYPSALAWDREDVDVLDAPAFESKVRSVAHGIDVVVNCVAFNDVDGAEDRPQAALALNGDFVGRLATLCSRLDLTVVHYSTNYVFDGNKAEYRESDQPSPLSAYGRSKLLGEELLAARATRHYLIRTAVIFGPRGTSDLSKKSFVELMLDLSAKKDVIQAVDDEINSVTYAPDLAQASAGLIESGAPFGTYHLVNQGSASWCDLARHIFRFTARKPAVVAVPGSTFQRKAARPRTAILVNSKAPLLRPWADALEAFIGGDSGPV